MKGEECAAHLSELFLGELVIKLTIVVIGSCLTLTPLTSRMVSPGNRPFMKAGDPGATLWTKV